MEFTTQLIYRIVGSLLAGHVLYKLVQRRIRVRNLPPKFWSWDLIMNLDWILGTALKADNYWRYEDKLGLTYRLPRLFNPMGAIVTGDPENVLAVMMAKDWSVEFRKTGMTPMLGDGFIVNDGPEWARARKMLKPAFSRTNLEDLKAMEDVADVIVKKIEGDGGSADLGLLLYDALMHSSMQFILGLDSREEKDGRPISTTTFNELWKEGILGMGLRLLLEHVIWLLPKARYREVCSKLHSFVDFAIDKSEECTSADSTRKSKTMAEIVGPQARDRSDARGQLLQTLLASQDTTATLVCNAVQLLSQPPHHKWWTQLRDEVTSHSSELFTWDGLRSNTLIQNVLHETLRFRPVFPSVGRYSATATVLPRGGGPDGSQPLPIPAGTFVIASLWCVHLNKDVYGPDAREFNPERWNTIKPSSQHFFSFGVGPRACLGKEKALTEAAYVLATLVKRFERVEDCTRAWKPEASLVMKNTEGYKVKFS